MRPQSSRGGLPGGDSGGGQRGGSIDKVGRQAEVLSL